MSEQQAACVPCGGAGKGGGRDSAGPWRWESGIARLGNTSHIPLVSVSLMAFRSFVVRTC